MSIQKQTSALQDWRECQEYQSSLRSTESASRSTGLEKERSRARRTRTKSAHKSGLAPMKRKYRCGRADNPWCQPGTTTYESTCNDGAKSEDGADDPASKNEKGSRFQFVDICLNFTRQGKMQVVLELIIDWRDRIGGVPWFGSCTRDDGIVVTLTETPKAISIEVMNADVVLKTVFECAKDSTR